MHSNAHNIWLHRYAVLTALATLFLIVAGALVTSNDAGLAVPDWPLSYGRLMPPMVGGIFYEHGHRMVATTVGMLTIGLAVWLWRREPRRWVRRLGYAALGTVIVQGILGGITVKFFLPPAVSIAHACLAQAFFCMVVSLAVFTSRWWKETQAGSLPGPGGPALFQTAAAATLAVYIQLILGAAVRHKVLGVLPHVLGATVVGVVCLWTVARVLRRHSEQPALARPAKLLAAGVLLQVGLGIGVWWVKYRVDLVQPLPPDITLATAHVATGAAVLATCLILTLRSYFLAGLVTRPVRVAGISGAMGGPVTGKAV